MNVRPVFFVIGILLFILGASMFIPACVEIYFNGGNSNVFLSSGFFTCFSGGMLVIATRQDKPFAMQTREGFLLTSLTWIILSSFAALPFYFSDTAMSLTDSLFESVSGITTTGSTVMTTLDDTSKGILIWRALLQWYGGIGIIVTALSLFPFLKIGGMQLFKTESSENEKAFPRAAQLATSIISVYLVLTVLCVTAYFLAGLSMFDAIAHAMTTIATGGFSTRDASIGAFVGTNADIVAIVFILLSALPFIMYMKAVRSLPTRILSDQQVRAFAKTVLMTTLMMAIYLVFTGVFDPVDALRNALFQVTVIITGTGYGIHDYGTWGPFPVMLIFAIMFVGGCSGSTTCSIKVFRYQILIAMLKNQIKHLVHPSGVFPIKYNGKPVPADVPMSVAGFMFLFFLSFFILALLLFTTGLDPVTAISSAATAICNVGPGLGDIVGPHGTFEPLPVMAKWIMMAGMLVGRLELLTFFVLIIPHFWKRA